MEKPIISLICSIAENRAIGKGNKLLWEIPEDLKHFKEITSGHVVIMGDKTYNSIGRPLPNRINIVLTKDKNFRAENCIVCHSLEETLEKAKELEKDEIFIIGGGQIYKQTIGLANKLYLTIVEGKYEADTYFPDYSDFKKIIRQEKHKNEKYKYTYLELEK